MFVRYFLVIWVLAYSTTADDKAVDIRSTTEGCARLGSNVTLLAHFVHTPINLVTVKRGTTVYGSCAGTSCLPSVTGIKLDASSASNISLEIISVEASDGVTWRFATDFDANYSDYDLPISNDLDQVYETSSIANSSDDSSYSFTWTAGCPYSNISIDWFLDNIGSNMLSNGDNGVSIIESSCQSIQGSKLVINRAGTTITGVHGIYTRMTIEECNYSRAGKWIIFDFANRLNDTNIPGPNPNCVILPCIVVLACSLVLFIVIVIAAIIVSKSCFREEGAQGMKICYTLAAGFALAGVGLSIAGVVQDDCCLEIWIPALICGLIGLTLLLIGTRCHIMWCKKDADSRKDANTNSKDGKEDVELQSREAKK